MDIIEMSPFRNADAVDDVSARPSVAPAAEYDPVPVAPEYDWLPTKRELLLLLKTATMRLKSSLLSAPLSLAPEHIVTDPDSTYIDGADAVAPPIHPPFPNDLATMYIVIGCLSDMAAVITADDE